MGPEQRSACEPWESLGRWPRADLPELQQALESLAAGAARWGQRAAELRQDDVARWICAAAESAGEPSQLARRIGFGEQRAWPGHVDLRRLARELDADLARPRRARGPMCVVSCAWSELGSGLLHAIGSVLQAGRVVLLLADERAPMAADHVYAALLASGLPADLLALLHGVEAEGLEFLAADARVGDLWASSSSPERMRSWRAWSERAGLAAPRLQLLRAGSFWVGERDDVQGCARRVVSLAFGAAQTLFGQAAGQVASVHVSERSFSSFNEALLRELEESGVGARALPMIDRQALDAHSKKWNSGLDQGATLIAGGVPFQARPSARDLRILPTVLTNVEPHMLCVRLGVPSPLLCLLRADAKIPSRIEV